MNVHGAASASPVSSFPDQRDFCPKSNEDSGVPLLMTHRNQILQESGRVPDPCRSLHSVMAWNPQHLAEVAQRWQKGLAA